jgi:hypothetical protein
LGFGAVFKEVFFFSSTLIQTMSQGVWFHDYLSMHVLYIHTYIHTYIQTTLASFPQKLKTCAGRRSSIFPRYQSIHPQRAGLIDSYYLPRYNRIPTYLPTYLLTEKRNVSPRYCFHRFARQPSLVDGSFGPPYLFMGKHFGDVPKMMQ